LKEKIDRRKFIQSSAITAATAALAAFSPAGKASFSLPTATLANGTTDGEVFNVKTYGAIGNGSTDDTLAIQKTIDTAAAVAGVVYIPEGNYLITSELKIHSNGLSLVGAGFGSRLTTTQNINILAVISCANIFIAALSVEGDGDITKIHQVGISTKSLSNSVIQNVKAFNLGYDGICLISGCVGCSVTGCVVENCHDDGINIGGQLVPPTTDSTVVGNIITNITHDGIHISNGAQRTTAMGNTIRGCDCGVGLFHSNKTTVTGNVIENSTTSGIHNPSDDCSDFTIADNVIRGAGGDGIDIGKKCTYFSITGNQISEAANFGINIHTTAGYFTITTNVIHDCFSGIMLSKVTSKYAITGNEISNCSDYGISDVKKKSYLTDGIISNNVITDGCKKAGIFLAGLIQMQVLGNKISGVSGTGIRFDSVPCSKITAASNHIQSGLIGIEISANVNADHFSIIDNTIEPTKNTGIFYSGGPYFNIAGNRVISALYYGISISANAAHSAGLGLIANNIVVGGCSINGIIIYQYDDVLVQNNIVSGIEGVGIRSSGGDRVSIGSQMASISGDDKTQEGIFIPAAMPGRSLGTVTDKVPVYDASGTLVGYVPIYNKIS
jgi:hypothetical protein